MSFIVERDWIDPMTSYRCVVLGLDTGHRCGYVGIPAEHLLYGVKHNEESPVLAAAWEVLKETASIGKRGAIPLFCYDPAKPVSPDVFFDVHGSLTFSDVGLKAGYPAADTENLWWFGFDAGHAGDARDLSLMSPEQRGIWECFAHQGFGVEDVIRTTEYCVAECESLARQLRELQPKDRAE